MATLKQKKRRKLKRKNEKNLWYTYVYNREKNEVSFNLPKN